MIQEPPSLLLQNVLVWVVPYIAYFLGIIIRKQALPGRNSPPLGHQMLLGIPIGLVVVSPSLTVFRATVAADIAAYLLSIGIIIEHGMLVQEEATKRLRDLVGQKNTRRPAPAANGIPGAGGPSDH